MISQDGYSPVASNGHLLWLEEKQVPGSYSVEYNLYLRAKGTPGQTEENRLLLNLKQGDGSPTRYDVSGDHVVWNVAWKGIYLYDIGKRTSTLLAIDRRNPVTLVFDPLISGDRVVWTEETPGSNTIDWQIKSYNITTGATSTVLQFEKRANVKVWGIIGGIGGRSIVYKVDDEVYLVDLP